MIDETFLDVFYIEFSEYEEGSVLRIKCRRR